MKKLLLLPIVCMSLLANAADYTIDTLIEKALVSSPDLNISRDSFAISKQRSRQADADYLPQVDLLASAGKAGISNSTGSESGGLITGKITASQLIYDFGKTGGKMSYYSQETNASFESYNQEVSNKINSVKRDYYDLLRKDNLIKVYEENLLLTKQQLTRAERYFAAGIKTKIDVVDARVRLIEAQIKLENSKYDLNLAYVTLDKTIGNLREHVKGHLYIPDLNLSRGLYDSLPHETMTAESSIEFAFAHRHELKRYQHKVKSAEGKVRQESGDYYPGLYVGGDYQYSSVEESMQFYLPEQQWNANINLKWNLFNGMRTTAMTEQAKLTLLQERATLDDAKLRILEETSNAYINLRKSDSNVKLSEGLVIAAKEKFEQAQKRYENGLSDYIELQEARQGYISANADMVSYYYEYFISLAALDRAIGR